MNNQLLAILACPLCKGELLYDKYKHEILCKTDRLAYPVIGGIPVMLLERARKVTDEEWSAVQ